MKIRTLVAIATSLCATHAIAADLPSRAPPPVFIPPVITTWTGCYGGVYGGYDLARVKDTRTETTTDTTTTTTRTPAGPAAVRLPDVVTTTTTRAPPTTVSSSYSKSLSGGDGGGRIGCNYQMQRLVVGGQVEGGYLGISGTATDPLRTTSFSTVSGGPYGALSAKIGFALAEKTLIYVRGGVGYAGLRFNTADTTLGYTGSARGSQVMPLVGAGLEYKLSPNWSLTGEYTYLRPGCRTSNYNLPATSTTNTVTGTRNIVTTTVDTTGSGSVSSCVDKHMFTFGLNYYFNTETPVVARY